VNRSFCCILFFLALLGNMNAQHYTISGYITDAGTKETLIGASVYEESLGKGVVSDRYGFFQFAGLKAGKHILSVSFVGYETLEVKVEINNRSIMLNDIGLEPRPVAVEEVSVIAASPDRAADRMVETSMKELTPKSIQSIPAAGNDVFSAIKFLPGIDRTEPFSPLFTVRGSEPGENAVLLDGVMLYNPYHSSISTGIFNTQTIKSVDLLTGGFGAEYGGRNSSVLYITTKDGNSSELHGEIEPSTFHSKMFLEFPVGERGSAMVAGRYFFDIFSYFIFQSTTYFYDFNLSYTYRLNPKNRITFKYFQAQDKSDMDMNVFYRYIDNTIGMKIYEDLQLQLLNEWTNRAATMIHKWVISPRLYMRTQLFYSSHSSDNFSGFDFQLPIAIYDTAKKTYDTLNFWLNTNSRFLNEIRDITARTQFTLRWTRYNTLTAGAEYNDYFFRNSAVINDLDQGTVSSRPPQWSAFAENKFEAGPLIIRPGVRFTLFENNEWLYEPRLNLVYNLPANIKLRAAWGSYNQYIISMNTNEVEMNQAVDYYFPLRQYKPSRSIHYIAGIDVPLDRRSMISADVYYKDIQRVYTFDVNQVADEVITLSDKLQQGSGNAYGAEIMVTGAVKNLSGWFSYSLAWANRKYPFFDNVEYPYDYNRRHTLKLVANYAVSKTLWYNASFIFLSGYFRSIEQIRQDSYIFNAVTNELSLFPRWVPNGKNNAKMPPTLNLDLSIRKRLRTGFGKQFSDLVNAQESYVMITIRNVTFFQRNVEYFFPMNIPRWEDKYLAVGTNYFPYVGFSYMIKF